MRPTPFVGCLVVTDRLLDANEVAERLHVPESCVAWFGRERRHDRSGDAPPADRRRLLPCIPQSSSPSRCGGREELARSRDPGSPERPRRRSWRGHPRAIPVPLRGERVQAAGAGRPAAEHLRGRPTKSSFVRAAPGTCATSLWTSPDDLFNNGWHQNDGRRALGGPSGVAGRCCWGIGLQPPFSRRPLFWRCCDERPTSRRERGSRAAARPCVVGA
jgi:hypothetical protein